MAQATDVLESPLPPSSTPPDTKGRRLQQLKGLWQPQMLVVVVAVLVIGYLALVPLLYLLWSTFTDGDGFTLRFFNEAYSAFGLPVMIYNSFRFALGATLLSVTIGTTLAYLAVRTDVPFKRLLFAAALIPLIIPGILNTIAWIFLLSPRIGIFNRLLEPIIGQAIFNAFSIWGMIFVEALDLSPLVFLLMYAAFRNMDPSLEESALMSGARFHSVVRRITLPLVRPGLYAAILIMGVKAIESFEVPAILGIPAGIWVFTSRIWRVLDGHPPAFGQAGAYAISLLVITTLGILWHSRLSRRARAFQTISGKGFRPHSMELGKMRWPAAALVMLFFLVAIVMPFLVLLYASTQEFYSVPSMRSLQNMTLDNYRYTFTARHTFGAFRNSLILGVGSATAVMLVMAVTSWVVVRTKLRGRWMIDNLTFLPIAIPGLVLGVALLFVYLRSPIPVYGTMWILFIAYFTKYMPYGMRYASTSMYQISGELEESAHTSGASWLQTFRRIILPLLVPGLLAGWIYVFMVAIRELSSSILLYSPGNQVLSIVIWELWENGMFPQLAALGIVMIVFSVILVLVAKRLGANVGVRE